MTLTIADSHEFLELYRGDKDLRMGLEFLKLRPDLRFYSFGPDAASPNDRDRFGIKRVEQGPLPELPEGFELRLIPSAALRFRRKESGGIVSLMPGYGSALRSLRPDILFENPYSWLTPRSYQTYAASRRCGFPVILYDPGDDIPVNWRQRLLAPVERPAINHASRIITYNLAGRRRFMDKYGYPGERIHVIPKPVDVARCLYAGSSRRLRETLSAGIENAFLVMYLGRLTKYKGSSVLLEVAKSAMEDPSLSRCRFIFVGGSLASEESEDDYRLANTYVTGMVPHEAVPEYLAATDVLVLPDLTNPGAFTTAAAEAMGAGVAIIAGLGGHTEFTPLEDERTALVVPPSDPQAILNGLRRLVADSSLGPRLGAAVGDYARREMDYPQVARQYLSIVDDVLSKQGPGAGRVVTR